MQSTQQKPRIHKRVTKDGCFFGGLRVVSFLLIGFGILVLLFGAWQFASLAWSQAEDLSFALGHMQNTGAQFLLSLYGVWFAAFAAIGCTGLAMIGIGFGLGRAATQPVTLTTQAIDKPLSAA